ncbi:MAG: AMP-binding protein [Actinomycetes bacterium]|nr:AMP-dependent synthetase [Acidimicrobiia bacterium]
MDQPIVWRPDEERASRTHTARFMARHGIATYDELYARSIDDPEWFWDAVVDYLGIPFTQPYRQVMDLSRGAPWARWFVGGQVNLSAACVDRWVESQGDLPAVIGEREDGESVAWTFSELREVVSRLAGGLARLGVQPGDAVGVFLPMSPEAIAAFLATARVGAVFIPIFSGYAAEAVANRLLDPRPRVLICADGFFRRGRLVEMKEVADAAVDIAGGGIDHVVVVRYAGRDDTPWTEGRDVAWADVLRSEPADALPVDSEHPVMIAYTSGTTGRPKGSVHVHGGFTVKIAQEGAFLTDVHPGDRLMWATDMGWIMGPWMTVAALANGATAVTYDGAPDHPGPDRLWEVAEKHRLTHLGLSPTLIRALQPHGADQARRHDLSSLRAFGSTGEPLNPDPWWWLFREVGGEQVPIVNISGGTEIAAVILGVNLLQGLKPSSLGGPSLGMAADVVDSQGRSVRGEVGELVLRAPWPGMTRGFWKEPERYLATYWERFEGVWVHGDWASIDEDGFWFLHGRSDDTLNIAGKRVGPAEIESAVVALDEVVMAAAIGVPDPVKGEAVVVYAVPSPDAVDDPTLADRVSEEIVRVLGKAFRPAAVHLVRDLPRTRSAKIMRRVVRALALGEDPGDLSSLENPESLSGIGRL